MTPTNAPAPHAAQSVEALQQKESALEHVRAERAKLEAVTPRLAAAVKTARTALDSAQLSVFVARGTPGFEDDAAAEASVKAAQADLDEVCTQHDAAQERLGVLERAEGQLQREIGEIRGKLHLAHMERAKAELRDRIADNAETFAAMIREVAALRMLEGVTTWPEELSAALEKSTPNSSTQQLVREGQALADRIRAGASVGEVMP
jgi:chromosome segregation ATPase